jgi:hypothetical protein
MSVDVHMHVCVGVRAYVREWLCVCVCLRTHLNCKNELSNKVAV